MVVFDNLASILGKIVVGNTEETQKEWRLLGQEKNGRLMVSWVTGPANTENGSYLNIGIFSPSSDELKLLHKFTKVCNVVQSSVNNSHTLLSYVTKEKVDNMEVYNTFIVKVTDGDKHFQPQSLQTERSKQIMLTFLNKNFTEKKLSTLMMLIHHESISLYHVQENDLDSCDIVKIDSVARSFTWAQWDCQLQVLYFIHFKKTLLPSEGEDVPLQELAPTLSGLQFHPELPHETVLNIPLNLPSLPKSADNNCCLYEDDPIPLRVHDCSLDLLVVSNNDGIVCICHHYLYQPVKPPKQESGSPNLDQNTVHFAYSVTLLHHGCVVHCVVPGIPWALAKTMRPMFAFVEDQHLVIYAPGLFTHLLDIGLGHEPFCHILLGGTLSEVPAKSSRLVPLYGDYGCDVHSVMIDMPTMDLINFDVTPDDLIKCFINVPSVSNRLAILHYFLVHLTDYDCVEDLLTVIFEKPTDLNIPKYLQEVLIGGAYISAKRNLPPDAVGLLSLLPLSAMYTSGHTEVKVDQFTSTITQEILWNTAMMLLSPQQRLVPYRVDTWTKLWQQLADLSECPRFKPSQVADKLLVSLVCYQPEALSRCSTPMSPGTSFAAASSIADLAAINAGGITTTRKLSCFDLPFYEVENCTASKQEHVISVNLRELSMHLLRNCQRQTPPHVHAVATRYVAAQVELSKQLCHMLTRVSGVDEECRTDKGFSLVQQMVEKKRAGLFTFYQRYYYAVDSLAYPLPQGFISFFTYLGFKSLPFDIFLQYVKYNVFELQIDVVKEMMNEIEDTKDGIDKKLRLLHVLPRSRAKRLLNTWQHPVSLMIRAREHSLNILSGVPNSRHRRLSQSRRVTTQNRGLAAFPSGDRLSPFDTFLDLLTAKASLTDLDFNLLIEATISSTEEFL